MGLLVSDMHHCDRDVVRGPPGEGDPRDPPVTDAGDEPRDPVQLISLLVVGSQGAVDAQLQRV